MRSFGPGSRKELMRGVSGSGRLARVMVRISFGISRGRLGRTRTRVMRPGFLIKAWLGWSWLLARGWNYG
eukprot:906057-Amphidinium_carterae.1